MEQHKSCCCRIFVIRKCIYLYLHSADDDHDEVAMYLLTYHQTNQSQQSNEQTKVIQEVVSPELSNLNHAEMSKEQGD